MKTTFNVGDYIIGKEGNGYTVTNENCILKVTAVDKYDGEEFINGTMEGHTSPSWKGALGREYKDLDGAGFRLATQEEINMIIKGENPKKEKPERILRFNPNFTIKQYKSKLESNFNPGRAFEEETDKDRVEALTHLLDNYCKKSKKGDFLKETASEESLMAINKEMGWKCFDDILGDAILVKALDGMIDFFKEFNFEPNFRFINTLALKSYQNIKEGKEYIINYFKLINSPYTEAVRDKITSVEFNTILNAISSVKPSHQINKHLTIFYGSQGTGKSTAAQKASTHEKVIVCSSNLLPQDILEEFSFIGGAPSFQKSAFCRALQFGETITLDEANLLPFDTLRFLQGILDGKSSFIWKGETINIHPDFHVIMTMNLTVSGMTFGLPDPLVDRATEIKEFTLTGKELLGALF